MTAGRPIRVPVAIYQDEASGADIILLTDQELDEQAVEIERITREARNLAAKSRKKDEKARADRQLEIAAKMSDGLAELRIQRDAAMKDSKTSQRVYVLNKPSYGRFAEAEDAAKAIQPDGSIQVDQTILARELLPKCVEGMQPDEVMALDPALFRHLWGKLYYALYPDRTRLPFSVRPSETTSTAA